jgi:hypothetical protein
MAQIGALFGKKFSTLANSLARLAALKFKKIKKC